MCGLCGVLVGRGHWTDPQANPEAFAGRTRTHTWHRERQERGRLLNWVLTHYGLGLGDWAGTSYVLKTKTGRSALIDNLTELWMAAEDLGGRACDPLDEDLLAALRRAGGS